MYKFLNGLLWALCCVCLHVSAQTYPTIGRRATVAEITAWDSDVRPDFRGLPAGSGSVNQGMKLWEKKCASCHAAGLTAATENSKTTLMKLATVSTLWDYIRRAMPFDAPKSLTINEVYAATAYLLHLADILPADFVLNEKNIAQAQAKMPNRLGMTTAHGMMDVQGQPDIKSEACMNECRVNEQSLVVLPPSVNGLNGNLAEQNRHYGFVRGMDTSSKR
jgi:cytochrome c